MPTQPTQRDKEAIGMAVLKAQSDIEITQNLIKRVFLELLKIKEKLLGLHKQTSMLSDVEDQQIALIDSNISDLLPVTQHSPKLQQLLDTYQKSVHKLQLLISKLNVIRNTMPAVRAIDDYTVMQTAEDTASFKDAVDTILGPDISTDKKAELVSEFEHSRTAAKTFHEAESVYLNSVMQAENQEEVKDKRDGKTVLYHNLLNSQFNLLTYFAKLLELKAQLIGAPASYTKLLLEATQLVNQYYSNEAIQQKINALREVYNPELIAEAANDLSKDRMEGGVTFALNQIRGIRVEILDVRDVIVRTLSEIQSFSSTPSLRFMGRSQKANDEEDKNGAYITPFSKLGKIPTPTPYGN